ncbi:hypothetical protein Zm00014a_028255 [Zea mays]|jgi:hypothetical protein|uniref:Uncharacterized protein n=2 Tax=Zea mays TaxID=4577 RepID=C4IY57_MAIZE|nr:unknown [Zea mays]ONL98325.1 hypothetical protein ZEAMMB73_Zm00001d029257 [Zea mays]PWZ54089.1 hypothetical protein Zm00014a_028255 [Zea mays]
MDEETSTINRGGLSASTWEERKRDHQVAAGNGQAEAGGEFQGGAAPEVFSTKGKRPGAIWGDPAGRKLNHGDPGRPWELGIGLGEHARNLAGASSKGAGIQGTMEKLS